MNEIDRGQRVIGWISAGIPSAVACKFAAEKYGVDKLSLWYFDIKSAHPDNERFINDCENWIGCEIHKAVNHKYEDQFEVIEARRYVNGAGGALCTYELKKKLRFEIQAMYDNALQVFGFDYSIKEINRAIRFLEQYPDTNPRFPLIEMGISKEMAADIIIKAGIKLPAMYLLGYSNNNCIGCVKGGKGYWNKIRIDFPDYFNRMAEAEREVGRSCIKDCFLDELDPEDGRTPKPILPDCGSLCEIRFEDIIDERAFTIYKNVEDLLLLY